MRAEHKYQGLSLLGAHLCTCGAKGATRERIDSHIKYYADLDQKTVPVRPLDHTPGFATGGVVLDREDRTLITKIAPGTKFDVVNKAEHYNVDPSGVECITIVRHRNFNIGNAIKYLWRAGLKWLPSAEPKEKQIEDLKKAIFYIKDEIVRLGGNPE